MSHIPVLCQELRNRGRGFVFVFFVLFHVNFWECLGKSSIILLVHIFSFGAIFELFTKSGNPCGDLYICNSSVILVVGVVSLTFTPYIFFFIYVLCSLLFASRNCRVCRLSFLLAPLFSFVCFYTLQQRATCLYREFYCYVHFKVCLLASIAEGHTFD